MPNTSAGADRGRPLCYTGGRFFAGFGALHPGFGWLGGLRTARGAPLVALAAHEAFDASKETEATRERYGKHEFGKCLLLARRFIEAGAGIVSVRVGAWDHHGEGVGGTITTGIRDKGL